MEDKTYSDKCYYCSKWVVVGGVGVCVDDLSLDDEPTDHSDTQCIHQDDL